MYENLLGIVKRKWPLAVLLAVFAVYTILMMTTSVSAFGHIPALADNRLSYSAWDLISILDSLGSTGRLIYLDIHMWDMFFPLIYAAALALSIIFIWGGQAGIPMAARLLAFLPLIGGLFDYAENVCVRLVSALFFQGKAAVDIAAMNPLAARLSGSFTTLKWTFAALSLLAIAAGAAYVLLRPRPQPSRTPRPQPSRASRRPSHR